MKKLSAIILTLLFCIACVGMPMVTPPASAEDEPTATVTVTPDLLPTVTPTPEPTATSPPPTVAPTPIDPFVGAPLCATHSITAYHGLWNEWDGCHFDHTHGVDPTSITVTNVFSDYTVYTGQGVSYPWQTFAGASPGFPTPPADVHYENVFKHEGYKFDSYDLGHYGTCPVAFPGVRSVPNAWLIERHSLGDHRDVSSRVHSVFAMVRFCIPNTTEIAWLITGGWQDFGQRIAPYQGSLVPYPDNPMPSYNTARQPYIAHGCVNNPTMCKNSPWEITWVSQAQQIPGHALFGYGFRGNDAFDAINAAGGLVPNPTFVYLCKDAMGNYNPIGCKYNNSSNHTFQVTGDIPGEYDLLDGDDDGRVNFTGWTDRWGNVRLAGCTVKSLDCIPVVMVNLPVGVYHVNLPQYSQTDWLPAHHNRILPDYSICFLANGTRVDCDVTGAIDAGWIGPNN